MGAEAVAEGVAAVGPFFGATGALIAGIAAGALGAWKKVKPGLTVAKTEAEQYHATSAALVQALESFKETNPTEWDKMGALIAAELNKQGIDPKNIENVIRALRGLPAKA